MKYYPEKYSKGDFVFFLHIPKTAGTSLTALLKTKFPADQILEPEDINEARKCSRDKLSSASLMYGHFTHDIYNPRLPKMPNYLLTMLRNPIDHFISIFFHLKRDPTFAYTSRMTKDRDLALALSDWIQDKEIEAFLEAENFSRLFDNFQTHYFVNGVTDQHKNVGDEELLEFARRYLNLIPFFGLVERVDDSMRLLGEALGWEANAPFRAENRATNKPRRYDKYLKAGTLAHIRSRVSIDVEFYSHANEVFEARLSAL